MENQLEVHWSEDMQSVKLLDHNRNGDLVFEGSVMEFAAWALVEKYGSVAQVVGVEKPIKVKPDRRTLICGVISALNSVKPHSVQATQEHIAKASEHLQYTQAAAYLNKE
jgi:hypothetical protein